MRHTRRNHTRPLESVPRTFGARYAALYDLFYATKDYKAECDHIVSAWKRHSSRKISSVLDLGCGTGGHALELARRGYRVVGVDRSHQMLAKAKEKGSKTGSSPDFIRADIRSFSLAQPFDAAIAMFAVLGYLTTDDKLFSALDSIRTHLKTGGIFLFDAWNGVVSRQVV